MSENNDAKPTLKEKIKELPKTLKVFWKTPPKGRYLNLKEIACFAGSAFGMSTVVTVVSGLITATQIPTIYNFNVIHGAWICLIASVLGLIIQPFFSKLLQNTNTRFGRYKPFILILAPILAVFAILSTWQPQFAVERNRVIYAYCTCIPTLILWNLFQNTYYMLPGVVTPNQQERADIWSPIGLVIGFSPTVMNVLGNVIKSYFTNLGKEYMAYRILGFVYAAVGLALVMCLFKVKERLIVTNENKEKVGLIEGLKMVVKNKPLMVLTLALILGCCRTVVEIDSEYIGRLRYAVTELGEVDVVNGLAIFGGLTIITGFAATPNMILLPLMTRKFNSRTIMMFWAACNTVGYLILGSIGIENIPQGTWSVVVITLLRFISLFNAIASLQPLMMAQLSDYQQLKTGKRLEGFIQTFLYALVLVFTNIGIVVMAYVKDDEDEFVRLVMRNKLNARMAEQEQAKRQLEKQERRILELDSIIQRLYEDHVIGKLTAERFVKMSAGYEQEQADLKNSAKELRELVSTMETEEVNIQSFLKIVKKYTEPTELTPLLLHEFVEKIVVHAPDRSSGQRVQQIDVHYNFIGEIDLSPEYIKTNT